MADVDSTELEIEASGTEDNEIYVPYDIATYPSDFTLKVIADMWDDDAIIIPDFQREFVWTQNQSSLLIESFLRGLPVPPVFFYVDEDAKNLVIDGQQRILSIVFYFSGYFGAESRGRQKVFRLTGLGSGSPYHNMRFQDLSDSDQRRLMQAVLRAINIRQLNPAGNPTSVYHIFERLNTGGTPLKPQEIRNCVFRGSFARNLQELNDQDAWRAILGRAPDKHQRDVELILRLFALYVGWQRYEKPMKEFLNHAMLQHRNGSPETQNFSSRFDSIATSVVSSLGPKPFHLRGPLNSAALDAVLCTLLDRDSALPTEELKQRYGDLCDDDDFMDLTSASTHGTQDTNVVRQRFALVREHLLP